MGLYSARWHHRVCWHQQWCCDCHMYQQLAHALENGSQHSMYSTWCTTRGLCQPHGTLGHCWRPPIFFPLQWCHSPLHTLHSQTQLKNSSQWCRQAMDAGQIHTRNPVEIQTCQTHYWEVEEKQIHCERKCFQRTRVLNNTSLNQPNHHKERDEVDALFDLCMTYRLSACNKYELSLDTSSLTMFYKKITTWIINQTHFRPQSGLLFLF